MRPSPKENPQSPEKPKKRTTKATSTVKSEERKDLAAFSFNDEVPVDAALAADELVGSAMFGGMESVACPDVPDAVLNGKSIVEENTSPFACAACTSLRRSWLASAGTVDMNPILGGSTEGLVRLPM